MKVVYDYPPNIDQIREVFTLHKGIVFTYGDIIYNPDCGFINDPLMRHEETHCKQQGTNPAGWWERYLQDPAWRVTQEVAAYRRQFKAIKKLTNDRERRHAWLCKLAGDLSGPMYGSPIPFQKAFQAIKHATHF